MRGVFVQEVIELDEVQSVVVASVRIVVETLTEGWVLAATLRPGDVPGGRQELDEFELRGLSRLEAMLFGVLPSARDV